MSGWADPNPNSPIIRTLVRTWLKAGTNEVFANILGSHQFGDANAKIVVHDEDFATSNQLSVGENVNGIAGQFVQRHDTPFAKPQNFLQSHLGTAKFDSQVHFDFVEQIDVVVRVFPVVGRQVSQRERLRSFAGRRRLVTGGARQRL